MTIARTGHIDTLLPDGKVFIAPADDGPDYRTADIYDPAPGGAFSAVDWHPTGLTAGSANLLPDGKLLFTLQPPEGDFDSKLATLYDVSTALFEDTLRWRDPSYWPSVQFCPTEVCYSRVPMRAAGWERSSRSSARCPRRPLSLSVAGYALAARSSHTATLLEDGTVLLAGGSRRLQAVRRSLLPAPSDSCRHRSCLLLCCCLCLVSAKGPFSTRVPAESYRRPIQP